jgi:O-antigen/teichoic acid export membrane protein
MYLQLDLLAPWRRLCEKPLVRNTGWLLAGQLLGLVLQAAYFVLMARLLGAVQYGIFIGAFAFTGIVASYSPLGTGMVLLRYISSDRKAFAVYWGNVVLTTISIGAFLTLLLHFAAAYFLNPPSAALVVLASLANCVCAQLSIEAGRACRAFEQMRVTAILNFLTSLMRTTAAIGMLLFLHTATAKQWAIASTAVSAVAALIAVGVVTARFGRPRFELKILRQHGVEGVGYSFAQSTTGVYNDVDKTMLCSFGLNLANGIYTVAYRIIDIATIPISSLHDAALPKFFQLGKGGVHESRNLALRLIRRAMPIACFMSFALFLSAPILPRVVGEGFTESVAALRWLCLIPLFRSIHTITGAALTGAGLQRYRTGSQITSAGLNLALNLWAIPHYGWLGAAWVSLLTDGALAALNWFLLLKLDKQGWTHASVRQNSILPA